MSVALRRTFRRASQMQFWPLSPLFALQSFAGMPDCENVASRLWRRGYADEPEAGLIQLTAGSVAKYPVASEWH